MVTIGIDVVNKIARPYPDARIVCDNDYILKFHLDNEWRTHAQKVVRVVYNDAYTDYPLTGDSVRLPAVSDTDSVTVGVFADGIATNSIKIPCVKSIRSEGTSEREPAEDVYADIVGNVNKILADVEGVVNEQY